MNEVVPRKELERNAMTGIGGIGGGLAILAVSSVITGNPIIGLVVAAGMGFGGYTMTKSAEDRTAGKVLMGVGAITALSALTGFGSGIFSLAGIGLIGWGGYSIYKFLKGMKSRQ